MTDVFVDLGDGILNHCAVAGEGTFLDAVDVRRGRPVGPGFLLRRNLVLDFAFHDGQAVKVEGQVLEDGGSVAEDIVGGEDCTDFIGVGRRRDDKGHVVFGVAGGVDGLDLQAGLRVISFNLEYLAILDVNYPLRVE